MKRLVLLCLMLAGCANPQIVQLSPGTYFLTRQDHAGVFGNANTMTADVIREATEFAEKQGKVAVPVSLVTKPMGGPGQFATVDYQFRLADKNSPEARVAVLRRDADVRIESNSTSTVTSAQPKDVYTEITKLDDLRKRGLLTDAEFDVQKRKLLAGQ